MKKHPKKPKADSKRGEKKNTVATVEISRGRKWLFRLVSLVALPVLLVLLAGAVLEFGLRLGGYGYDTSFFRQISMSGQKYLVNNENFCQRFFPPQLVRWPAPFKFEAVKPPDTTRIFIFGESAAMGDPQPAYGAGRYMEVLLRKRFPQRKFEVINLGITAIDSHVILPIARECADQSGDFWIIYMGNNEMVGPFGAATVFGARALPRRAAQLNLSIQKFRSGQLMIAALRNFSGKSKNASWGGMEMFLENQIAPNDSRKNTVYANFEANLQDIVTAGVNSGANVVLSTMSVNLRDCPPFASFNDSNLPAADLSHFDQLFNDGKTLESHGEFSAAAQRFTEALRLQPNFAEAHFWVAQCELMATNRAATSEFQAACDLDALPFRADTHINSIIRQVAKNCAGDHLTLADAEQALSAAGLGGVAGKETFYEHVHFNFDGNYRLGKIWAEQIARILAASDSVPATSDWASQSECERSLALTLWNREFVLESVERRLNAAPLSTQFNNAERLQAVQASEQALRREQAQSNSIQQARTDYAVALKQAPDDADLYEGEANFFESIKDPESAVGAYRKALELRGDDFYSDLQLGRLLGELGSPAEGEPFLKRAAALRPSLPDAWFELGNVFSAQSKFSAALDCMDHASRLRPRDATYVLGAGQLLGKLGRHEEAIERYRRAIGLDAGNWESHFALAGELVTVNEPAKAMEEYAAVLKINPNHVISHINLGVVLVRFNRFDEAIDCFQEALRLDPANQAARQYLASVIAHKAGQQ